MSSFTKHKVPKGHYMEPYHISAASRRSTPVPRKRSSALSFASSTSSQSLTDSSSTATATGASPEVTDTTLNVIVVHFKSPREPVRVRHLPARDFVEYVAAHGADGGGPVPETAYTPLFAGSGDTQQYQHGGLRPGGRVLLGGSGGGHGGDDEARVKSAVRSYAQPGTVLAVPADFTMPHIPCLSRATSRNSSASGAGDAAAGQEEAEAEAEAEPLVHDYYLPPESRALRIREDRDRNQVAAFFKYSVAAGYRSGDYCAIQQEDRRAMLANERRGVFLRQYQRDLQAVYRSPAALVYRNSVDAVGGAAVYDVNYQLTFLNTAGGGGGGGGGEPAPLLYTVGRELPEDLVQTYYLLNDNYHSAVRAARRRCAATRAALANVNSHSSTTGRRGGRALLTARREHRESAARLRELERDMPWGDALLFRQQLPADGIVVVRVRNQGYATATAAADVLPWDVEEDDEKGYQYGSAEYTRQPSQV